MIDSAKKVKPEPALLPGQDAEGNPIFSVILKRTYDIVSAGPTAPNEAKLIRAEKDLPLTTIDEYYDMGDPQTSTVKFEADLAPFKALTDVVFIGKAISPGGKPVTALDVGLQVEGVGAKIVRVMGPRKMIFQPGRPPLFTSPEPFTEMEIRYENAYGGKDKKSLPDGPFHYPRNDMGKGMFLKYQKEIMDGMELPTIEDPVDMLTPEKIILNVPEAWPRAPMPQGLGWFQRTWYPRGFYAGSVPPYIETGTMMKEEFLGLIWKDHIILSRKHKLPGFHVRFMQGASPGLSFPHLKGNEIIKLRALTSEGMLQFALPAEEPSMRLDIGKGYKDLDPVLHTVLIRGEDRQVDLVWRGSMSYPGIEYLAEMTTLAAEVA